jgi:hypothetical protein
MYKKILGLFSIISILVVSALIIPSSKVLANSNYGNYPNTNNVSFGTCPNPGGNTVASYNDGWHAIVGSSTQQWGTDVVYSLGNNNYTQCFCPLKLSGFTPDYNTGIQSNWYKVDSLISDSTKQWFTNNGWTYISNGADYGLTSGAYYVKNYQFNCQTNACVDTQNYQSQYNQYQGNQSQYPTFYRGKGNAYGLMKKMFGNNDTMMSIMTRHWSNY